MLLALLLCCAAASAETALDVTALTDDQLCALYREIRTEAALRGLALADILTLGEGRYIVGEDIEPGAYIITCVGTDTEELSRSFGSLGAMMDGLSGNGGSAMTDLYSSLGSLYASLDEGVTVEIIGDYGTVIKSVQLKKGESATLTLEGRVALKVSEGTCQLESK